MRRRRSRLQQRRRHHKILVYLAVISTIFVGWISFSQEDSGTPAVSKVVYPQTRTIRFDHRKHSQDCATCHASASTSQRVTDNLRPPMEACAGCHGQPDVKPALSNCAGCHLGYPVVAEAPTPEAWRAVRPAPMRVQAESANIRFDHAKHVALNPGSAGCASCHANQGPQKSMPSMESCNTCHNGRVAPSSCTTCHPTDDTTRRIKTTFTIQGQPGALKPDNHQVDWVKRHGPMAKSNAMECSSCHQEAECADCHVEQVAKPYTVHMPNYVVVHAIDARSDMGNCTDCHSVETYCTSCHVRANVTMRPSNSPPPRATFHPPGWLNSSLPNNHGVMARRNIDDCASCHSENDCVSCHAGVNPHPPEFALNCRTMLAANPTPCAKCHQDVRALKALCQ